MSQRLKPINDFVLIKRKDKEQKVGSIIIPASAQEKQTFGEVMSVGPGKTNDAGKRIASQVCAGDVVLFGKYAGQEIQLNGETLVLVREDEILGIVEGG